jgi:hypothetical protein
MFVDPFLQKTVAADVMLVVYLYFFFFISCGSSCLYLNLFIFYFKLIF